MKKTIIHVAQSAGGVAEYLYMLIKNIDREQYNNILIVSEDYKNQEERFKNIVEKIYFVPMTREINLKSDLISIIAIRKILRKEKSDIVYLHSSKAGAIGRIALLFNFKRKILYNAHGWYFNANIGKRKKKIFSIIEKILAIKTDMIINISQSEYDSAIKYKIAKSKKMCIIENGIDFSRFKDSNKYREETRTKYNIKEDDVVIGVVGRISEQKDPMTSIKAFELVHKENNKTKLMLVGSGELEKEVLEYARQNNIENDIIITGWVNDVEKYIPAFDIAILPSRWEGFGLVIIEYMACDKPIVASNVGGIGNIIKNEENGLLINVSDYIELANNINNLIKNEVFARRIIENNKVYRKKYDIQLEIEKYLKLVNIILYGFRGEE